MRQPRIVDARIRWASTRVSLGNTPADAMTPSTATTDPQAIARTALYCCGVRAADARAPRPVCADAFAQRFMDAAAQQTFAAFTSLRGPNATNAARHRLIDDLLRERLQADPSLQVVLLGAGFDTRAYRLRGGRWLELDHPVIMQAKELALPAAQAANPLRRVAIDFAHERLADKLTGLDARAPVLVVMEGVSMYLDTAALGDTARTLHALLPRHTLVCDLMDRRFAKRFGGPLRRRIMALGGDFAPLHDDPCALVESLGYQREARQSIVMRAVEHGSVRVPRWLLGSVLRSLRDGYVLCRFRPSLQGSA